MWEIILVIKHLKKEIEYYNNKMLLNSQLLPSCNSEVNQFNAKFDNYHIANIKHEIYILTGQVNQGILMYKTLMNRI